MDAELPNRQSIRKRGWNFAAPGRYFVTINTHEGHALFGLIVNGQMLIAIPRQHRGSEFAACRMV